MTKPTAMNRFNAYGMLRVFAPYVLGILTAYLWHSPIAAIYLVGTLLLLAVVIGLWTHRTARYRRFATRHLSGGLFTLFFFTLGYLLYLLPQPAQQPQHYSHHQGQYQLMHLRIDAPIATKANSYKSTASVLGIRDSLSPQWQACSGQLLLYFHKDALPPLHYGDEIVVAALPRPIPTAHNPHAFDYAHFMQHKHIAEQLFVNTEQWTLLQGYQGHSLQAWAISSRHYLLQALASYPLPPQELAVASSILLGYDDYLSPQMRQNFAGSGALHVLCVSGLHVGIIYMIFQGLFGFMTARRWSRHLYYLLLFSTIWMYALITGLAAPVLRAATMFSIIILGKVLNRHSSIYNSLASSAFLLLLFQPQLLFSIGFQFSYLSVLSIFFFQPLFSQCCRSRYTLINKLIDLSTVSVAAQLGLFPLAIYYFHLFPHYFLLSNIFVIPLSFAVLLTGLLNFGLYLLGLATTYLGALAFACLHIALWLLTHITQWIQALPGAFSTHLYFSTTETWLLYLLIISLSIGLIWRRYSYTLIGLLCGIAFFAYNITIRQQLTQQQAAYILHDKKTPCIAILQGRHAHIIAYGSQQADAHSPYSPFGNLLLHHRIQESTHSHLKHMQGQSVEGIYLHSNSIVWAQQSLCIVDERQLLPQSDTAIFFNTLILSHNPKISITQLQKKIKADRIIFDATNSSWRIHDWQKDCDSLGLCYYDISTQGACRINP